MSTYTTNEEYFEPQYLLPYKTRFRTSENLAVRFNHFVPFDFSKFFGDEPKANVNKRFWTKSLSGPLPVGLCRYVKEKQVLMAADLLSEGYSIKTISAIAAERLAAGLGNSHPAENGLLLHHVYGLPYLSGSGLKGIARAWVVREVLSPQDVDDKCLTAMDMLIEAEGVERILETNDRESLRNMTGLAKQTKNDPVEHLCSDHTVREALRIARQIFGRQGLRGNVVFFDAFPVSGEIEGNVMTPHSSSDAFPQDTDNPNPILFATIARGAIFCFHLASRDAGCCEQAGEWLKKALEESGAGGKTAVGLGHFDIDQDTLNLDHDCFRVCNLGIGTVPPQSGSVISSVNDQNFEHAWLAIEDYVLHLRAGMAEAEREEIDKAIYRRLMRYDDDDVSPSRFRLIQDASFIQAQFSALVGDMNRRLNGDAATVARDAKRLQKNLFLSPELRAQCGAIARQAQQNRDRGGQDRRPRR